MISSIQMSRLSIELELLKGLLFRWVHINLFLVFFLQDKLQNVLPSQTAQTAENDESSIRIKTCLATFKCTLDKSIYEKHSTNF